MSQLYFALVDVDEIIFLAGHERVDMEVVTFGLTHNEGEFASLALTIRNPRIGLLNAARKQWVWFSIADASTDGAKPLFFGRIVAVPQDPQGNIVSVTFVARPVDVEVQKLALAATLRVHPWWDPVWIAAERRSDPEAVLDARTARWHTDRVSHVVTTSNTITGEDGTINFAGDFIRDSLSIQVGEPAVRKVHVEAEVDWEQRAKGNVNLTALLLTRAQGVGSGDGHVITTYTGQGLAEDWPKRGDDIGAGWSFGFCQVRRGDQRWVATSDDATVVMSNTTAGLFPLWSFTPVLHVHYDASRSRSETISFDLSADVQAILSQPDEDQVVLRIALSSSDIGEPIDPGPLKPIRNPSRRSYFKTARGHRSLEYAIALARKELLERSRAVTIGFEVGFNEGFDLSCRMNARIADPRLPGGEAAGKIIAYSLSGDGDTGVFACKVTIGCMVGEGNTVSETVGDGEWSDDAWVGDGWQTRTGDVIMPIAGEVTYNNYNHTAIDDDGVDFARMTPARVVQSLNVIDGKTVQRAVLYAYSDPGGIPFPDLQQAIDALNQVFTEIDLTLRPLNGGPYHTDFAVTTSALMVPKTIDLSAAST